jgi:hypothetical protein
LHIEEHVDGDTESGSQIVYSSAYQDLPPTPGRVTWTIPATTLRAGRGYGFRLARDPSKCRYARQTTWAHNGATVNGGRARCTVGPQAQPSRHAVLKRMWHVTGVYDRQPACASSTASFAFDPSMPEGWLVTNGSSNHVMTATRWQSAPSPATACGQTAANAGARVVLWRSSPGMPGYYDYVCMWPHYGPLQSQPDNPLEPPNHSLQDGWYYGIPWKSDSTGGIRDAYLKLDTIDYEALLYDHVPEFRYDDDERFYPMSVASITDFYVDNGSLADSNALKGDQDNPEEIAVANPNLIPPLGSFPADPLTTVYLGTSYPSGGVSSRGGTVALASDFLSERGSHSDTAADDARIMENDPSGRYIGKIYGHVATDSQARIWLQYFRFYYYNDQDVFGFGSHEGDWESVQVRLDTSLQPDLVSFEAHDGEETCNWADVETSDGRVIAWVGAASHGAYSRPGQYRLGLDNAQGDGVWLLSPDIQMVTSETAWMQWPGRWGDSGGNSPVSPLHQGSKWDDPDAWTGNVDDCDMGDPL